MHDDDTGVPGAPSFRATIIGDLLTLHDWLPSLWSGGPARRMFRGRRDEGIAIADLRRWRGDDGSGELSVEFLSRGDQPRAERALEGWARLAGYSRVWFPDRVVDLRHDTRPLPGAVEITCQTCWAQWEDDSPEFWKHVLGCGEFPRVCPLCGGEMPQWDPVEAG